MAKRNFNLLAPIAGVFYVAIALLSSALIDLYSNWLINWAQFHVRWWRSFDPYSFVFWFIVPFTFLVMTKQIDWGWLSLKRLAKIDIALLCLVLFVGAVAVLLIPLFPSLESYYTSYGNGSVEFKVQYAGRHLIWLSCWLLPWEFLLRYVLLRAGLKFNGKYGWLIVPVFEVAYHLIKPWPEAIGMLFFSVFLTQWTVRRRSIVPAFLAHLIVEIELLAFLLLV